MIKIEINYKQIGNGKTFVFLLHGWGANLKLYDRIANVIAEKYTVTAFDFPGFGESPEPPSAWDVSQYAEFTKDFISSFNADKVILIGHSFGGRVIIKLMNTDLPFTVEKIVLIDSAGIKPKKKLKTKIRQRIFKTAKLFLPKKQVEKMRSKMGSADYNAASPLMKQVLVKTVNEDLSPLITNIKASTLLVWGENDTATPLSDGQAMEKMIKGSGLVTLKGGHFSFLDSPVVFEKVIKSFLEI